MNTPLQVRSSLYEKNGSRMAPEMLGLDVEMSSRGFKKHAPIEKDVEESPPSLMGGVKGALVLVDGTIRAGYFPLESDLVAKLAEETCILSESYSKNGLPPKSFYCRYDSSTLLVVFSRRNTVIVWMELDADLAEVEKAARRLVSTAHLAGTHRLDNPLLPPIAESETSVQPRQSAGEAATGGGPSEETNPTLPLIMSWSEATTALESILTKVLTQAQASKMIEKTLADKGINPRGTFSADLFRQAGTDLLNKIPNRTIRQSLTKEFEALVARMS